MIEAMFIASQHRQEQVQVEELEVVSGSGIVGDRNFGEKKYPGQNITFIEIEEIDNFNARYGQSISLESTRRNIITKGVRLNDLVGKEFKVGEVRLRGVELCEPCAELGMALANKDISKTAVVKAFKSKGGLRADILSNGKLSLGLMFA